MNPDLDWQRRYEENDTPWDKGAPAPPLVEFLKHRPILGRVLVPGCGRGHEVRALARPRDTTAVGLDLSPLAVAQARKLAGPLAETCDINFIEGDFFALPSTIHGSFDWLVEHTCFCAIEPRLRPDYVRAASTALRSGGRIFAIFYIDPDTDVGPPFAVSREQLSQLFDPLFILQEEWVPRESFPSRENRELIRILQKR
jgi:SAM-dependent methyltransferase